MKKITSKDVLTCVTLVGFVALFLVYMLVYRKYMDLTEQLEMANQQKRKDIAVLKEYYDNRETYEQAISKMQAEVEKVLEEYPSDVREEDVIMLAVDIQKQNQINYSNISMRDSEIVYSIPVQVVTAAGWEEYTSDISFVEKQATYVNETDYFNLKDCVKVIYENRNRISIHNIAYSRNEEMGTLEGNIDLTFYSMRGTGKEYVAPDIADYLRGTENPFRLKQIQKELEEQ